ncbi:MAG: hypothetical protein JOZ69_25260 [Myxococcales bacterium]|nr:hypothetical protein [Myxococcales bacterium]
MDDVKVDGDEFEVLPGCHTVTVAYTATFHGKTNPLLAGLGVALSPPLGIAAGVVGAELAARQAQTGNTKKRTTKYGDESSTTTYETIEPVVFDIEMKSSIDYWFKATFNGSEFLPEVIEQDDTNSSFTPGMHCPSSHSGETAR